jgi:hypothetical protein
MKRTLALAVSGVISIAAFNSAHAVITETYILDRTTVHSSIHLGQIVSTGETLADTFDFPGSGVPETSNGDLSATFTWSDGFTATGTWSNPSGKNLVGLGPILFPGVAAPGVHFNIDNGSQYSGFIEQSGDTFSAPWEIRNGAPSTYSITQVVLSALGSPDMGFDTDDGTNPGHGFGGNLLTGDDALSTYSGNIQVTYDWFNNWAGTTDMFHRLTIDFLNPMGANESMVFRQDTDETAVPLPAGAVLMGSAIGMVGLVRRFRKTA